MVLCVGRLLRPENHHAKIHTRRKESGLGKMTFDNDLTQFYQNRSKYPRIKPDMDLKMWSRYDFRKGKTFHETLHDAAKRADDEQRCNAARDDFSRKRHDQLGC